jgi:DNA sulfur modification protein DndC
MNRQENIFGTQRIEFNEQIELTVQSLNAYGPLYNHWAIAWSMGKDSTTLVTLIVQLIESGQVQPPRSITVLLADTRMELLPLWLSAIGIIENLKEKKIEVKIVMAPIDDRYFVYILGRGVTPPSNTFRWCTDRFKVKPMTRAIKEVYDQVGEKLLLLTGVRQGESAIRDGRIAMSCGKDGAECGQGWYQLALEGEMCSTLAPILHWRVCSIWDWLQIFAPSQKYGSWPTKILADAYGGDEAEEKNARTGCVGCPLAAEDKGLNAVCEMPYWSYLTPLKRLKEIYRQMKRPMYRLRKDGQVNKDGKLSKNQQRLGPLTLEARLDFLEQILSIQREVNESAVALGRPIIDILNAEEEARIRELIALNTWPQNWTGDEVKGDVLLDKKYADGSVLPNMFKE